MDPDHLASIRALGWGEVGLISKTDNGSVYRARRQGQQAIAIKVIDTEDGIYFGAEIDVYCRFKHPHLMRAESIHPQEYCIIIAMPLALGSLVTNRPADIPRVFSYIHQAAQGLAFLHENGVLHLDVKPDNMLLHEGRVMLCDFGLSDYTPDYTKPMKLTSQRITAIYRPDECEGEPAEYAGSSDIWSLGISLLYLCGVSISTLVRTDLSENTAVKVRRLIGAKVSPDQLTLAQALLHLVPESRPTARAILDHPAYQIKPPLGKGELANVRYPPVDTASMKVALVKMGRICYDLGLSMEALFLAIELLYRLADLVSLGGEDQAVAVVGSLMTAIQVAKDVEPKDKHLLQVLAAYGINCAVEVVVADYQYVISKLQGVIYTTEWWRSLVTHDQVKRCLETVLAVPSAYHTTSPHQFTKDVAPDPKAEPKRLTVRATWRDWIKPGQPAVAQSAMRPLGPEVMRGGSGSALPVNVEGAPSAKPRKGATL